MEFHKNEQVEMYETEMKKLLTDLFKDGYDKLNDLFYNSSVDRDASVYNRIKRESKIAIGDLIKNFSSQTGYDKICLAVDDIYTKFEGHKATSAHFLSELSLIISDVRNKFKDRIGKSFIIKSIEENRIVSTHIEVHKSSLGELIALSLINQVVYLFLSKNRVISLNEQKFAELKDVFKMWIEDVGMEISQKMYERNGYENLNLDAFVNEKVGVLIGFIESETPELIKDIEIDNITFFVKRNVSCFSIDENENVVLNVENEMLKLSSKDFELLKKITASENDNNSKIEVELGKIFKIEFGSEREITGSELLNIDQLEITLNADGSVDSVVVESERKSTQKVTGKSPEDSHDHEKENVKFKDTMPVSNEVDSQTGGEIKEVSESNSSVGSSPHGKEDSDQKENPVSIENLIEGVDKAFGIIDPKSEEIISQVVGEVEFKLNSVQEIVSEERAKLIAIFSQIEKNFEGLPEELKKFVSRMAGGMAVLLDSNFEIDNLLRNDKVEIEETVRYATLLEKLSSSEVEEEQEINDRLAELELARSTMLTLVVQHKKIELIEDEIAKLNDDLKKFREVLKKKKLSMAESDDFEEIKMIADEVGRFALKCSEIGTLIERKTDELISAKKRLSTSESYYGFSEEGDSRELYLELVDILIEREMMFEDLGELCSER